MDFRSSGFVDVCSVFWWLCTFCLFVVLCLWYTFVVSNVYWRVPKTESDFGCTEKAEFTDV